jgi:hypothetical protein
MTLPRTLLFTMLCVASTLTFAENEIVVSDESVKQLAAQLASPNKAPLVIGNGGQGPDAEYPAGFDKKSQETVFRARSKLDRLGLSAFPHLINLMDDTRYCMTVDDSEADRNYSVGETCIGIIRCRLEPYNRFQFTAGNPHEDPRGRARRPCYTQHFLGDRDSAQKWWNAHKDKTLLELQVEVLEWIIDEEARNQRKYTAVEREFLNTTLKKMQTTKQTLEPSVPWIK